MRWKTAQWKRRRLVTAFHFSISCPCFHYDILFREFPCRPRCSTVISIHHWSKLSPKIIGPRGVKSRIRQRSAFVKPKWRNHVIECLENSGYNSLLVLALWQQNFLQRPCLSNSSRDGRKNRYLALRSCWKQPKRDRKKERSGNQRFANWSRGKNFRRRPNLFITFRYSRMVGELWFYNVRRFFWTTTRILAFRFSWIFALCVSCFSGLFLRGIRVPEPTKVAYDASRKPSFRMKFVFIFVPWWC